MQSIFIALFIIVSYVSLFPFNFNDSHVSWQLLQEWLFRLDQRTTHGDALRNILLFFPLGFTAYLNTRLFPSPKRQQKLFCYVIFLGIFALLLQIAQFYLPSRVAAMGDVILNMLGVGLGVVVANLLGGKYLKHLLHLPPQSLQLSPAMVLIILWVVYKAFPVWPSWYFVGHFEALIDWHVFSWQYCVINSIGWLLCLHCLQQMNWDRGKALFYYISLVFLLEFFARRNMIFMDEWLALCVGLLCHYLLSWWRKNRLLVWLAIAGVLFLNWFILIPKIAGEINWIPFYALMQGSVWQATEILLLQMFLLGSCVYLAVQMGLSFVKTGILMLCIILLDMIIRSFSMTGTIDIGLPVLAILATVAFAELDNLMRILKIQIWVEQRKNDEYTQVS